MRDDTGKPGTKRRNEKSTEAAKSRLSNLKKGAEAADNRPDYTRYRLSVYESLQYILEYLALDGCISYLFFSSWFVFVILLAGFPFFLQEQKKGLIQKRAAKMKQEFLDGIQMTAASLQAGYSIENAFRESVKELEKIYEKNTFIVSEFRFLSAQMDMNQSIEWLLMDLGRRSGVADIQSFAEVFLTAKRSGGDLLAIIHNTISCIRQKQETMQEIETCLAGKVMEQNIMSLVPVMILAYVRLASPEFLEGMYGNLTGIIIMSICFGVYLIAYFWGKSIVRIEV